MNSYVTGTGGNRNAILCAELNGNETHPTGLYMDSRHPEGTEVHGVASTYFSPEFSMLLVWI